MKCKIFFFLMAIIIVITSCTIAFVPTPIPTPIPTATSLPSPTPLAEFSPEHFAFPVAFNGDYQIESPLRYVPCYHWDGITKEKVEEDEDIWRYLFHAGDMFILNLNQPAVDIVVISPTTGVIEGVNQFNDENIEINIKTPYYLDGKRIYVDIVHSQRLFPGDDKFPEIHQGDNVEIGQPIAIQNLFLQHGREEQVVDIGIRNGPSGANPSIGVGDYFPESYIDPILFLEDDILLYEKYISYDDITYRDHCSESIHFPHDFLDQN